MCLEDTKTSKKSVNLLVSMHSLSNSLLLTTLIILRIAMRINIPEATRNLIWRLWNIPERDKRKG